MTRWQVRRVDHSRNDVAVPAIAGEPDLDTEAILVQAVAGALHSGRARLVLDHGRLSF